MPVLPFPEMTLPAPTDEGHRSRSRLAVLEGDAAAAVLPMAPDR